MARSQSRQGSGPPGGTDTLTVEAVALAAHRLLDAVPPQDLPVGLGGVLGGFKWSSQHLDGGVAMSTRRRRSDRSGRGALRSPGRPAVARREDRRRFWAAIAAGGRARTRRLTVGVSPAVGARWFREAGGMPPSTSLAASRPPSGRSLSFAEREELALLRAQGHGVREIARRLGRAPSTISRELRRNAATRGGGLDYRATTAQWHAERAARRPKPAKLAVNVGAAALRAGPAGRRWSSPRAGRRSAARP